VIEIRRTLSPTDSSDFSQRALDQAVALAQRFGAALHVVHVIPARLVPVAPVPAPEPVPLQPPTRDVSEALETAGVDEPPAIDPTVVRGKPRVCPSRNSSPSCSRGLR